jgi:hypothetical protein
VSAVPAENPRKGSWLAPGTEPDDSPLVSNVLERLQGVLDELGEVSLGTLAEADVVRLLDASTAASSRLTRQVCRVRRRLTVAGSAT